MLNKLGFRLLSLTNWDYHINIVGYEWDKSVIFSNWIGTKVKWGRKLTFLMWHKVLKIKDQNFNSWHKGCRYFFIPTTGSDLLVLTRKIYNK